ncbi:hypothetical protein K461DRAFT_155511 [Myriangium duriaei CBS 260.36]|uniref:Protein DOM34 homolog n=1 Tax=Myriangium duriaei CBS 260.36 TaxID=1168546 RepID=A0A9P4IZC1_9PEZI|nr:hypothetical protein K461DRAFT_155511 [Myriangium duriaei CBS 260.36]
MKLIRQSIDAKTLSGTATLLPTSPEDMWSCYNLLSAGDKLRAAAVRRVTTSTSTGSTHSERIHTTLTLTISSLDFDPQASQLHVNGRVSELNEHVRLGQHHTLDLELNRNFTLEKSSGWDSVALRLLRESTASESRPQLWAVLLEEGVANICIVTSGTTIVRQTVTSRLGSKTLPGYGSSVAKFYQKTLDTLLRAVDPQDLQPILVAGPGFVPQTFANQVKTASQAAAGKGKSATDAKLLRQVGEKLVLERAPNAAPASLANVLASPGVQKRLADTAFARETALLDTLFARMRTDEWRVVYGPGEVEAAVDAGAVGKGGGVLLISDELFRSMEIGVRKRWVGLVDRVRDREGGEVRVLSSAHESGDRLKTVGGVAALLTFPLFEVDEDEATEKVTEEPKKEDVQDEDEPELSEIEM